MLSAAWNAYGEAGLGADARGLSSHCPHERSGRQLYSPCAMLRTAFCILGALKGSQRSVAV